MTRAETKRNHFLEEIRRKTGTRELDKRILIVCEDTKSSVNYFMSLRTRLKLTATSIEVEGSDHETQPQQVVNKAAKLKQDAEKDDNPFDEVWCVIDGDFGQKITNARLSATANDIKLAVTTPCFEYWLLLHFEDFGSQLSKCDRAVGLLRKHLETYQKGMKDFSGIVAKHETAAKRAKARRNVKEWPKAEEQNPCSDLGTLIDHLRPSSV